MKYATLSRKNVIEKQTVKNSKYIHQKIKEVTGKNPSSRIGCLKSKDGQILMGKNEILNRWSEYIKDLYNDERCPAPPISNGTEGSPILVEEVEHALKKMKKGKAAGPDDVPIELITALQDIGIMEVTKLLNIIYNTGEIPHDLTNSVFNAIPKKPGKIDCEQHRTISLMSHITKVLLRVLL